MARWLVFLERAHQNVLPWIQVLVSHGTYDEERGRMVVIPSVEWWDFKLKVPGSTSTSNVERAYWIMKPAA